MREIFKEYYECGVFPSLEEMIQISILPVNETDTSELSAECLTHSTLTGQSIAFTVAEASSNEISIQIETELIERQSYDQNIWVMLDFSKFHPTSTCILTSHTIPAKEEKKDDGAGISTLH